VLLPATDQHHHLQQTARRLQHSAATIFKREVNLPTRLLIARTLDVPPQDVTQHALPLRGPGSFARPRRRCDECLPGPYDCVPLRVNSYRRFQLRTDGRRYPGSCCLHRSCR
ncbi:unnamed protein product, partial [Ectocarpus fasciculatus]